MTRIIRIALAVLAVAFAVPGIAGATQVTVRPATEGVIKTMVVPLIPKHQVIAQYRIRRGYKEMYNLAWRVCGLAQAQYESAHPGTAIGFSPRRPEENASTREVAGFAPQVGQFDEIRQSLIPLMRRLNLGYPPTLTDFSGLTFFEVRAVPHKIRVPLRSNKPELVEVGGEEIVGGPLCEFELTK